ncbi:hypothetical protein DSO57_1019768 [Entomophthora muscae]|uniref:Uncharacterized protein n=2 Tax=Entomophthora muscae TaxID=34485 RepID=A0ACC2RM34_9FUNG|nr:hypothetical protein DSO57_1007563 [Entomophthora muscae]KAJ9073136.1 hypothetical protein DSO57_1019768 [Entomophthora muscae]
MGGVIVKASCVRRTATRAQYVWQWVLYNSWVLGTCTYCSVIFVLIICKLNENERNLSQALGMSAFSSKADDWRSLRYNSTIKSLIRRV